MMGVHAVYVMVCESRPSWRPARPLSAIPRPIAQTAAVTPPPSLCVVRFVYILHRCRLTTVVSATVNVDTTNFPSSASIINICE